VHRVEVAAEPSLRTVINATGVVVHTNLGRAPLPKAAIARVAEVASSYANLEFDLDRGERGDREVHAERRLQGAVGAESAEAVNNNSAAVLLAVNSLADGREVIVSRGELVEIGGSFRIPDVLRKGGARLVEVGTTNRTRLADYRDAINPQTGFLLKVHPSNFRMVGFTEMVEVRDLAGLAHGAGLPVVEDLGSGVLEKLPPPLDREASVAGSLEAGVDVVTFSGDKLLGGPQAGLVVGRRELVARLRKNPLYRALRLDKMTLAALDAVLSLHERGRAAAEVPVRRMLALTPAELRPRAEGLAQALRALGVDDPQVADDASAVGGGAAPGVELPTVTVTLRAREGGPDALAGRLRHGSPPVVARVAGDRLVVDLRTVLAGQEDLLAHALADAWRG
jgi:L-seryl-tRNA(Ser) seleniumtransferase